MKYVIYNISRKNYHFTLITFEFDDFPLPVPLFFTVGSFSSSLDDSKSESLRSTPTHRPFLGLLGPFLVDGLACSSAFLLAQLKFDGRPQVKCQTFL